MIRRNQAVKDIISTLFFQFYRLISGPLMLFLIPIFLTKIEQGYWYLFSSLAALSTLADLGFSNIILQFSAHEFAHLSISKENEMVEDEIYLRKLGSFFRFSLRWVGSICVITFPIIFLVGVWYLSRDTMLAELLLPWSIYTLGSSMHFFMSAILSFIEGMERIQETQGIRLKVAIINTIIVSILLVLGCDVFSLASGMFISSLSAFFLIPAKTRKILYKLMEFSKSYIYDWKKEIIPLFTRYALSFASGYFIFQIYTPLMHYFHGPELSGKVGFTLSIVNAIFGMSNIWIYTVTPRINIFVSLNKKAELDEIFMKRLILAVLSYVSLVGFLLFAIEKFEILGILVDRMMPIIALIILLICYLFQLIINSLAVYLRAHKQEPYVVPSLISAIWVLITTTLFGAFLKPDFFFLGLLSSYLFYLPVCILIYAKCLRNWYSDDKYCLKSTNL